MKNKEKIGLIIPKVVLEFIVRIFSLQMIRQIQDVVDSIIKT